MIDITYLREKPEELKRVIEAKQLDPEMVDRALNLDKKWRGVLQAVEELRKERNVLSKNPTPENISRAAEVKRELKKLEKDLLEITGDYDEALKEIPNTFSDDTPLGKDESDNKVIKQWGEPRKMDFEPKDHLTLGENLGIIDVKTAAEVAGTRFSYFKGGAALLEFALIQFTLSVLTNEDILKKIAETIEGDISTKPFIPVVPPVMIRPEIFDKMARLKPEDERYYIPSDNLYLIGSAEHTLGPLHMDEVLSEKDLPIRYVGFSTSFRREAGSYGKDTKGVLRVHQFDKIEMESFTGPENSLKEQDFFVAIQEYLVQQLEIPYQLIAICTGDMGKPDFRQRDINCWMPGQGKYRETHTSDLMTDYQARRLNTKVRVKDKTVFAHMNDATAFAIGRTIIAIMENYQQKDGTIIVPEVLRKYLGKDKIK